MSEIKSINGLREMRDSTEVCGLVGMMTNGWSREKKKKFGQIYMQETNSETLRKI